MSICTKVRHFLRLVLYRILILPIMVICLPLMFIIFGEGSCESSIKEIKDFFKWMWKGCYTNDL